MKRIRNRAKLTPEAAARMTDPPGVSLPRMSQNWPGEHLISNQSRATKGGEVGVAVCPVGLHPEVALEIVVVLGRRTRVLVAGLPNRKRRM